MRRLFLKGMTGHDGFSIMDVYARARHTGLLDVYKGKPVMTRHCRLCLSAPSPAAGPADARDARHRVRGGAGIAMTDRTTPRVLDLTRTSQAHRSKPRVTPKINHRSAAKCLEGAVGASRHEPGTYVFPGDLYGQENV